MLHVIEPRSIVVAPVNKHVLAMARLLAVDEAAFVPVPIEKSNLTGTIYLVSLELTLITGPICPHQHAMALLSFTPLDPAPSVLVTAFECKLRSPFCLLGLLILLCQFSLFVVQLYLAHLRLLNFLLRLCLQVHLFLLTFSSD